MTSETPAALAWLIASSVWGMNAVVSGDDNDGDVGDLSAAGTHLGERLMAGRIEEGDRLAAVVDAPGADDLGDAARFGSDECCSGESCRAATSCHDRRVP